MASVYDIVTERITRKLEQGTVPWRQPWINRGQAVNWITQKPYRGINAMLLDPGEYATFNQIKEAGGTVKKGSKSSIVVFYKKLEIEDESSEDDKKTIPYLRYYSVFEINTQCEGLESRRKDVTLYDHDPIKAAEQIKEGYRDCPPITFAPGKAYFCPLTDEISIPALTDYHKPEEFYSTMFHEMIHSTGHKSRLNRAGISTNAAAFGSETYSKEELVAEIGAAMLCAVSGIDNSTIDNSAAYIGSWLRRLKDDSKLIVSAASAAQKAADHIQGIKWD